MAKQMFISLTATIILAASPIANSFSVENAASCIVAQRGQQCRANNDAVKSTLLPTLLSAPRDRRGSATILSESSTDDVDSITNDSKMDWTPIAEDVFKDDKRPVILFDGVCNLCNWGVNFALDNDSVGEFRFTSLQSSTGQALLLRAGKDKNDISSIVLVTEEKAYFKSEAVLRIAKKLDGSAAFPVLGTVGQLAPAALGNLVYDFVAENRYRFGEADSCRLDGEEFESRFISEPES